MPLSLPLFTLLDKYVVGDGVPGIVNANKEEQQRRSANDEQSWARMGVSQLHRSFPIRRALSCHRLTSIEHRIPRYGRSSVFKRFW